MDTGIKRTQRDYTMAFKLSVVQQVEEGELTYKQAQQRYGIQGRSTVLTWLRKHGRQGWSRKLPLTCCTRLLEISLSAYGKLQFAELTHAGFHRILYLDV